jgi:tetratricopeptide (TPR) repeat protein
MTEEFVTPNEEEAYPDYMPGYEAESEAEHETILEAGPENTVGVPEMVSLSGYRLSFGDWFRVRFMGQDVVHERQQQVTSLTRAIEQYPDAPANYVLRGELYQQAGMIEQAEADFEAAIRLADADYDAYQWGVLSQALRDRALNRLHKLRGA